MGGKNGTVFRLSCEILYKILEKSPKVEQALNSQIYTFLIVEVECIRLHLHTSFLFIPFFPQQILS